MFYVVNDIERIGDHAENFADFTKTEIKHNTGLTGDAKRRDQKDVHCCFQTVKTFPGMFHGTRWCQQT